MKFNFSFKVDNTIFSNGTRYITEIPGVVSVKADYNTIAFKPLYKDESPWLYCSPSPILTGENTVSIIGNAKSIKVLINGNSYTLLEEKKYLDTIVSNFTSSNYLNLFSKYRSNNNALYEFHAKTGTQTNNILIAMAEYIFAISTNNNSKLYFWNWGTNTGEESNYALKANQEYWIKVSINGTSRTYSISEDNVNYTDFSQTDTGIQVHPSSYNFLTLGRHSNTSNTAIFTGGKIVVNDIKITEDNVELLNGNDILSSPFSTYSNFSSYNYITIPASKLSVDNSKHIEYIVSFTTPSSTPSSMKQVIDFGDCFQLYFNGNYTLNVWNNADSVDASLWTLDANKKYWVKFERYNGVDNISLSENGTTFGNTVTVNDSYVQSATSIGYVGQFRNPNRAYSGSIHLDQFKLSIDGELTFDGSVAVKGTDYNIVGSSLNVSNDYMYKLGSPTFSNEYSGEDYPELKPGSLHLYQDWRHLKDVSATAQRQVLRDTLSNTTAQNFDVSFDLLNIDQLGNGQLINFPNLMSVKKDETIFVKLNYKSNATWTDITTYLTEETNHIQLKGEKNSSSMDIVLKINNTTVSTDTFLNPEESGAELLWPTNIGQNSQTYGFSLTGMPLGQSDPYYTDWQEFRDWTWLNNNYSPSWPRAQTGAPNYGAIINLPEDKHGFIPVYYIMKSYADPGYSGRRVASWTVESSTDNDTWVMLYEQVSNPWKTQNNGELLKFKFNQILPCNYIKYMQVGNVNGDSSYTSTGEFLVYGYDSLNNVSSVVTPGKLTVTAPYECVANVYALNIEDAPVQQQKIII